MPLTSVRHEKIVSRSPFDIFLIVGWKIIHSCVTKGTQPHTESANPDSTHCKQLELGGMFFLSLCSVDPTVLFSELMCCANIINLLLCFIIQY